MEPRGDYIMKRDTVINYKGGFYKYLYRNVDNNDHIIKDIYNNRIEITDLELTSMIEYSNLETIINKI